MSMAASRRKQCQMIDNDCMHCSDNAWVLLTDEQTTMHKYVLDKQVLPQHVKNLLPGALFKAGVACSL